MHAFVVAFFCLAVVCAAAPDDGRQRSQTDQHSVASERSAQAASAYSGYNNNAFWSVNPWRANPNAPEPWRPYNNFRIIRQYSNNYPNGYQFSFNTENQIQVAEEGEVPEYDPNDDIGTSSRGYYQYVGDDGLTRRVDWTANEEGFKPVITIIPNYEFRVEDIARSAAAQEFPVGGAPLSARSAPKGTLAKSAQDHQFGQNKK